MLSKERDEGDLAAAVPELSVSTRVLSAKGVKCSTLYLMMLPAQQTSSVTLCTTYSDEQNTISSRLWRFAPHCSSANSRGYNDGQNASLQTRIEHLDSLTISCYRVSASFLSK